MTEPVVQRGFPALAEDIAELRAAYAELPHRLAAAYSFEGLWNQFVARLRPLVQAMDGAAWDLTDPRIATEVAAVDDLRLELYSRQSTALPVYRDPFNTILHTSLRMPDLPLYELFGREGHPTIGPIRVMSLARFDAQVADGKSDIVRYRLELEAELRRQGTRLLWLEGAVPRVVWLAIRSALWKDWRRRLLTTAGAVFLAALTPPVQAGLAALWRLLRR